MASAKPKGKKEPVKKAGAATKMSSSCGTKKMSRCG